MTSPLLLEPIGLHQRRAGHISKATEEAPPNDVLSHKQNHRRGSTKGGLVLAWVCHFDRDGMGVLIEFVGMGVSL